MTTASHCTKVRRLGGGLHDVREIRHSIWSDDPDDRATLSCGLWCGLRGVAGTDEAADTLAHFSRATSDDSNEHADSDLDIGAECHGHFDTDIVAQRYFESDTDIIGDLDFDTGTDGDRIRDGHDHSHRIARV